VTTNVATPAGGGGASCADAADPATSRRREASRSVRRIELTPGEDANEASKGPDYQHLFFTER
jgi:hypothetical protein